MSEGTGAEGGVRERLGRTRRSDAFGGRDASVVGGFANVFSDDDARDRWPPRKGKRTYAERGEEREEPRAYHDPCIAR